MSLDQQTITFHIGVHKSGTTFLQNSVFPNIVEGAYLGTKPSLSKLIENASRGEGPFLVSSEHLSGRGHLRNDGFEKRAMIDALADIFDDKSRVIIFFREPSSWIVSLYSQYILKGGAQRFHEWCNGITAIQYRELLDAIEAKFPDRYLLFDYEQLFRDKEKVLRAIENFSGVRFSNLASQPSKNANVSLKCNAMRLARFNNMLFNGLTRPEHYYVKYGLKRSMLKKLLHKTNNKINEALRRPMFRWLNNTGGDVVPGVQKNEIKAEYQDEWRCTLAVIERNQKAELGEMI